MGVLRFGTIAMGVFSVIARIMQMMIQPSQQGLDDFILLSDVVFLLFLTILVLGIFYRSLSAKFRTMDVSAIQSTLSSRSIFIAISALLAALLLIWMNTYETVSGGFMHRNRITGTVCHVTENCWFGSR